VILEGYVDVDPSNNIKTYAYPIVVELPPGTIEGTVMDSSSGEAIANATVTVNGMSATSNSSGAYVISDVPPGNYTVTVSADGYEDSSETITVTAGETETLDFTLKPVPTTGTITGTVMDSSSGEVIANATVTVNGMSATSNSSGAYVISVVPPGNYTVTVSADGYEDSSETITVTAGETKTLDFTLKPVQPLNILLYAGVAAIVIGIVAAIAVYNFRVRKPKPT